MNETNYPVAVHPVVEPASTHITITVHVGGPYGAGQHKRIEVTRSIQSVQGGDIVHALMREADAVKRHLTGE